MKMRGLRRARGFTLLELMIALAIFALLVTMAYQSVNLLLDSDRHLKDQQVSLQELQRAVLFWERDLSQVAPRPMNTGFGQVLPALQVPDDAGALLEFTRGGNPDMGWQLRKEGQMRSTLQRVRYVLDKGRLLRQSWNIVDHVDTDEPVTLPLLNGVKSISLRYMSAQREWQEQLGENSLPLAVEVTLDHERWGKIVRIFVLG